MTNTIITFLFCSVLFTSAVNADEDFPFNFLWENLGQPEEQVSFSSEEKKTPLAAKKGHNWTTYKQSYGVERVEIKFPSIPEIKQEGPVIFNHCTKKKAIYSMVTAMPPVGGIDPDEAFPLAIASVCQHPNYLLGYKTSNEDGYDVLDITSQNHDSGTITKARLIITQRNFYLLRTMYPFGTEEDHDYFLRSFSISH